MGLLNDDPSVTDASRRPFWRVPGPARIGEYTLRAASNELLRGDTVVRLRPRLMDVLLRLAAEPGDVVPRKRLIDDVWPRRMVSDEVLSRTIAELRVALGDDPRHARYIETIPTVGYRLVASVGQAPADETPRPAARSAPQVVGAEPGVVAPTALAMPVPQRASRKRVLTVLLPFVALAAIAGAYSGHRGAEQRPSDVAALDTRLGVAVPITSDPGLEVWPRLSPDGTRVAYGSRQAWDLPGTILVQDVERESTRRVIADERPVADVLYPIFDGDRDHLAFIRCRGTVCEIAERNLGDNSERMLVGSNLHPARTFDLSRDGRQLVFEEQRSQQPDGLALLDRASGKVLQLTAPDIGMADDTDPRFSPDGTQVAFFRGRDVSRELWTIHADGTHLERAVPYEGLTLGAAWIDSSTLLVAADWFKTRALDRVDLATHTAEFAGARGAAAPDVGRNGAIVFEAAQFSADLWSYDLATGVAGTAPLWSSTRFSNAADIAPDNQHVAFISNREGNPSVYVATLGAGAARASPNDGMRYVNVHWSHDSHSIYAVRMTDDDAPKQQGVRIDVATGRTDVLSALGDEVTEVIPDRGGRYVYFGVRSGVSTRLMRAPLSDLSAQERLPFPLAHAFALNASSIAFTQPQLDGITLCNMDTLACEALPVPVAAANSIPWALAADAIYYVSGVAKGSPVVRFDLATRQSTTRIPMEPYAYGRSLAVSPDGRTLLATRPGTTLVDLMYAR